MTSGIYIGPIEALKNKRAIIQEDGPGRVKAQFDLMSTGLGLGWHGFSANDFRPVADTEALQKQLRELTDEERLEIINVFCNACGSEKTPCQCWNDE